MAWRDTMGSRRRLALYLCSMATGVAAVVAISSFGLNLEGAIDSEAQVLLGADMSLERNRPFESATEALIDSIGGAQVRRVSCASMALFTRQRAARLVTIRASEPGYPFYGTIETDPPSARIALHRGQHALVDGSVMRAYSVQLGDSVQVGSIRYRVAGSVVSAPRSSGMARLVNPAVYLDLAQIDTSLLARGARATYEVYFRVDGDVDTESLRNDMQNHLDTYEVGLDTIEEEKEAWGEALGIMATFLGLVGFLALVLGGLGIGSALHVHMTKRLGAIAALRCLGATTGRTFAVYLAQALALGLLAGIAGCVLGVSVQQLLPVVTRDVLPVNVSGRL